MNSKIRDLVYFEITIKSNVAPNEKFSHFTFFKVITERILSLINQILYFHPLLNFVHLKKGIASSSTRFVSLGLINREFPLGWRSLL
ncbi:MAG TPA: hypothetical protein PKC30_09670 [Saprospiraceae bacterium]|nr:hypothetical protein [Saprospiraceae bacterium]